MVEPVTLPRLVAPAVSGNRIQRANASEDRKQGSAFEKQLRRERRRGTQAAGAADEEPGEGESPETGAATDEPAAGEVLQGAGAEGLTQVKTIDIRV